MVLEHWTSKGKKKAFDINPGLSAWKKILKHDSKSMIHKGKKYVKL